MVTEGDEGCKIDLLQPYKRRSKVMTEVNRLFPRRSTMGFHVFRLARHGPQVLLSCAWAVNIVGGPAQLSLVAHLAIYSYG